MVSTGSVSTANVVESVELEMITSSVVASGCSVSDNSLELSSNSKPFVVISWDSSSIVV